MQFYRNTFAPALVLLLALPGCSSGDSRAEPGRDASARACAEDDPCALGQVCVQGMCADESADTDGDGIAAGSDCDDGDPAVGARAARPCEAACGAGIERCEDGEYLGCRCACGNGVIGDAESCDDGNSDSGDGCSSDCAIEPGFGCSGEPSGCAPVCGDGQIAGTESCDDGNADPDDGCSEACTVESGYDCDPDAERCAALCGDGAVLGAEACDDGNAERGDGCDEACAREEGWACAGEPSMCMAVCGDGLVRSTEGCDDGDTEDGDGCSSACTEEPGWRCEGAGDAACAPVCGDGLIRGGEMCDDGNEMADDGCTGCIDDGGWTCQGEPSACVPICGDGAVIAPETCDDANAVMGDGCGECMQEAGWSCGGQPSSCTSVCGDALIRGGEMCDDGNDVADDGCTGCATDDGWECMGEPSSCGPVCGDEAVIEPETCDDGNGDAGDGCSGQCQPEPGYDCAGEPSTCTLRCDTTLTPLTDAEPATSYTSDEVMAPTATSSTGVQVVGEPTATLVINGGDTGARTADVSGTDAVALQLESSPDFGAERQATIVFDTDATACWSVTTRARDEDPDPFDFTDLVNQPLSSPVASDVVSPTGFDDPVAVTITGDGSPELSVDGGARGTSATISPGQSLQLFATTAGTHETTFVVNVTVGTRTVGWNITTQAEMLVNGAHSTSDCTAVGGTVWNSSEGKFCRVSAGSCPSGWTPYQSWSSTISRTCTGRSECPCEGPDSCSTGAHAWSNNGLESCSYYSAIEYSSQEWRCCDRRGLTTCYASYAERGCY